MPKPVLSDSLFNADDVATAVLSEANLQVTNQNLGVTDISSKFDLNTSDFSTGGIELFFHFNGFVFASFTATASSTPANLANIYTINDSDFYPASNTPMPTVSYLGDTATFILFKTDGNIQIYDPNNSGNATFYITVNGFYRIN